ncbi:hypothetical protein [Kribbella sp. NPDC055071]
MKRWLLTRSSPQTRRDNEPQYDGYAAAHCAKSWEIRGVAGRPVADRADVWLGPPFKSELDGVVSEYRLGTFTQRTTTLQRTHIHASTGPAPKGRRREFLRAVVLIAGASHSGVEPGQPPT